MLKELLARYEEKYAAEEQRQEAERAKGKRPERVIAHWTTEVLEPLAQELAKRAGKKGILLFGPYGTRSHACIVLVNSPESSRYEEGALELTVVPEFEDGHMVFWYMTGETCEEYESGTMGEINRLNYIIEKLPDEAEEILKLFKGVA